jgi:RNA polymerase Rpb1, domain 5/RNA polymerase Rpb1, domain 4
MLITRTITKKILETIVHETFSNFGVLSSSSLLDSLKLLGFYYATNAGISINIEDLKTPDVKKDFIKIANNEINEVSKQWQQGFVSDTERFQTIIDSWNFATESLKNRIVDYYQVFDPANNLYIMAFSGARGNMSQVRQLVGMRGLMSDQEGKIIDLPIQANFREGLSSIDYIISSYGARKGIVDTALKTADSGYLTRRLIYIAQDLIVREIDCKTTNGLLILLNKNTDLKNIVGRTMLNARMIKYPYQKIYEEDTTLTLENLKLLKQSAPLILNVRSSLTCKSNGSICQKCYGWDLAQEKLISLGEAVGIIAAQSIGEPGTQLTMRTFHTGGIFTSEMLKQITAPFSGKIIIPKSLKTISYRTNHGTVVLKLQQEANLTIINWKGFKKDVWLDIGSYLYLSKSSFVKEGQLLAEYSTQSSVPGTRRLKPIYTSLAGEIRFENLLVRKMLRDKRTVKVNQDDGVLWIASGKIFPLPKEIKYTFPRVLGVDKPFAKLKIVSPYEGIVLLKDGLITIKNQETKFLLDLLQLTKKIKNCSLKFLPIVQNYQYIDKYTVITVIEIYPNYEGLIYSVRKKESKYIATLFVITEADIWKINSDQVNDFSFFQDKKAIVRSGNSINTNSVFSRSGFFLKKDGFKMVFQNATPIFLSRGTILNYKQGDFVLEKKIFATLVNYTQQTEDIVQGLPKIEELVEARRPKIKAQLSRRPGIILNSSFSSQVLETLLSSSVIKCISTRTLLKDEDSTKAKPKVKIKKKQEKQKVAIGHSIYLKDSLVLYKGHVYKATQVPTTFEPIQYIKEVKTKDPKKVFDEFIFKNLEVEEEDQELIGTLLVDSKLKFSIWKQESFDSNNQEEALYRYKNKQLIKWTNLEENNSNTIFRNIRKDYIVYTSDLNFVFLEALNPTLQYEIPLASKLLFEVGNFVDIGEPITEGIVDVHDLLNILFKYHSTLDGVMAGTLRTLYKFQLLLVNSVQSIYQSQGVSISSKHIEIIVRQMTSKVLVKETGDTPFLPGEVIRLSLMNEVYEALKISSDITVKYKTPKYEPILMSATNSSLNKDGFLSAAGFQETKRVLTRAALEGSSDWLRGLKECIIIGRLIPAGSAFLNYKSYLDNVYSFKEL